MICLGRDRLAVNRGDTVCNGIRCRVGGGRVYTWCDGDRPTAASRNITVIETTRNTLTSEEYSGIPYEATSADGYTNWHAQNHHNTGGSLVHEGLARSVKALRDFTSPAIGDSHATTPPAQRDLSHPPTLWRIPARGHLVHENQTPGRGPALPQPASP